MVYTSDSITGLSGDEKALLADNFSLLSQDLQKFGERLFIIFFTDYPENKNYFADLKGKTMEEIVGSPKLKSHALNVMNALNRMIVSLKEPEILAEFIKKIGYGHGTRNLQMQAFIDLKTCFVKFLREILRQEFDPKVEEVWGKLFDVVTVVFQSGVHEFHNRK